jgi:hypothetical protein
MPKKKPYGGLTKHQVRLIRKYLQTLYGDVPQATMTAALFAWINVVMMGADGLASLKADAAGLASGTVKALRAGLEVLKRKLRRRWDRHQLVKRCGALQGEAKRNEVLCDLLHPERLPPVPP